MIFYYVTVSKLLSQFAWLLIPVALYVATLAVKQLAREFAYDAIGIYNRWQTAKADIERRQLNDRFTEDRRRVELTVWQREARAQITQQRTALQLGSAAMWKMGVFDIEIEESK